MPNPPWAESPGDFVTSVLVVLSTQCLGSSPVPFLFCRTTAATCPEKLHVEGVMLFGNVAVMLRERTGVLLDSG